MKQERGAYQAGVWAWREEHHWKPDLVAGSSVGAINGAAIASGVSAEPLGLHSLLHFDPSQTQMLFDAGYQDAQEQLNHR